MNKEHTRLMCKNLFVLLIISLATSLTGCGGGAFDPSEGRRLLYSVDFTQGNSQWATIKTLLNDGFTPSDPIECWKSWRGQNACTIVAPVENGMMILQSPWWLDNNHAPPGAGFLNLLAYTYMGKPERPADPSSALDLTNGLFVASLQTDDLNLRGSQVLFWFQVLSPNGKSTNYALSGSPVLGNSTVPQSGEIYLNLPTDPKMWQCLGSSTSSQDSYDCSVPFEDAIKNVNNDYGLIIMPTVGDPDPNLQPSGKIAIKWINLFGKPSDPIV